MNVLNIKIRESYESTPSGLFISNTNISQLSYEFHKSECFTTSWTLKLSFLIWDEWNDFIYAYMFDNIWLNDISFLIIKQNIAII